VWTRTNFALSLDLDLGYKIKEKKAESDDDYLDFVGTDPNNPDAAMIYGLTNQWEDINNLSETMKNSGAYTNTVPLMFNAYTANGIYDIFGLVNTNQEASDYIHDQSSMDTPFGFANWSWGSAI